MDLKKNPFSSENILVKIKGAQALAPADTGSQNHTFDDTLETLLTGEMELQGLMPWSSNYTFLASIFGQDHPNLLGIYKPGQGERPLWDFPDQTLSHREFTAYLVSVVLGWPSIPPTVLRDGPHGLGSVQLFVEAEYEAHYFNMRGTPSFVEEFRRMALFDFIVNNADRKGGHCLKGKDGTIWAIDHGLTFHVQPKLRTVIWDFSDEVIPDPLLQELSRLQELLHNSQLCQILTNLISPREIEAFKKRVGLLVSAGQFPAARRGRNMPFPPI